MAASIVLPGVEVYAPITPAHAEILTPEALAFVVDLQRAFNPRRKELLVARHERQKLSLIHIFSVAISWILSPMSPPVPCPAIHAGRERSDSFDWT